MSEMPEQNVFEIPEKKEEEKVEKRRPLHSSDFIRRVIKPQHIDGMVITRGSAANLPSGSSHVLAYFETDTNKLKIWNGTAWVSTTLS